MEFTPGFTVGGEEDEFKKQHGLLPYAFLYFIQASVCGRNYLELFTCFIMSPKYFFLNISNAGLTNNLKS